MRFNVGGVAVLNTPPLIQTRGVYAGGGGYSTSVEWLFSTTIPRRRRMRLNVGGAVALNTPPVREGGPLRTITPPRSEHDSP